MMNTMLTALLGVMLSVLLSAQPGLAQSGDDLKALRKELEALRQGQKTIQRDVEAIKNLLTGRRAPQPFKPLVLSIADDPFKGDPNARVTVVEFSDYQ